MCKELSKKTVSVIVIVFCLLLTGCGEPMVELTDEEEAQIVAYAAKVVTKHNIRMGQGLVRYKPKDENKKEQEEEKTESQEDNTDAQSSENAENSEEAARNDKSADSAAGQGQAQEEEQIQTLSLSDALGVKGVNFAFKNAEVTPHYTYQSAYDLEPNPGNKYVVMTFAASNAGGSDADLDINSIGPRFTATVGAVSSNAEQTILLNDLATYAGTIPAGGSEDLVLLFQFAGKNLGDISDLSLTTDVNGKKSNIKLQ